MAEFPGARNWGYDGVLLFAPHATYGHPDDLKAFVDAAHQLGIMVIFDVVYNHLGGEGNLIPKYWSSFLSPSHETPWGKPPNFDGEGSQPVREFILHNALYWTQEFNADGLRLDASNDMTDDGPRHILDELAERIHLADPDRYIHLILEDEHNASDRLALAGNKGRQAYTAQWNHNMAFLREMPFEHDKDSALHKTKIIAEMLAEGFHGASRRTLFRRVDAKQHQLATNCHLNAEEQGMAPIFHPIPVVRTISLDTSSMDEKTRSRRGLYTEWIVTNGLGGYASGTVGGLNTRRFHGWLIAALPAPHGRTMMANGLSERFIIDEREYLLSCHDTLPVKAASQPATADPVVPSTDPVSPCLTEFRLESGLPVWTFRIEDAVLEKRVCMLHQQNTTYLSYNLLQGRGCLELSPNFDIRPHEGSVSGSSHEAYRFSGVAPGFELNSGEGIPPLRIMWQTGSGHFRTQPAKISDLQYRVEKSRGYDWQGNLWSPGIFSAELEPTKDASLVFSMESWENVLSVDTGQAFRLEQERRQRLLQAAPELAREGLAAELVLAADQFLITPIGRTADQVRAHAVGDQVRSVIAGYHWFTDWGRDTMISLEGLTLSTGRWREAEYILRSFSRYIHNGLIPNLFPEGGTGGLYHTADATLWFFHAVDRYVTITRDINLLEFLLPKMVDIIHWHLRGTDFGIHVDPQDGLLSQGAIGYQLTWMDAKVGDWVVTPRRGKAVEINALWYNALCLTLEWLNLLKPASASIADLESHRELCRTSFQKRFWNEKAKCLFDVIDSPVERDGVLADPADNASIRPNQVIAMSLKYPVLDAFRWKDVIGIVQRELLTPFGLRSLSPGDPEYKKTYDGDLRTRDAAYHQGTVWAWLIGPFCNAWLQAYPNEKQKIGEFLRAFDEHLSEDGSGTISEIFDAEAPFLPRGCIAQAWSVAEVLRCLLL